MHALLVLEILTVVLNAAAAFLCTFIGVVKQNPLLIVLGIVNFALLIINGYELIKYLRR